MAKMHGIVELGLIWLKLHVQFVKVSGTYKDNCDTITSALGTYIYLNDVNYELKCNKLVRCISPSF